MKKTKKALASLAIASMILSMVPFNAFASEAVATRLAGNTAVQTAQAIAKDGWTASTSAVIAPVAAYNMVDALSAAPLAAALQAPILLAGGDQLSTEVKDEIKRLGIKTVYVTSGLAVIKAGVIAEIQALGVQVKNLGGFDQYETSVNIAKEIAKTSPTTSIFIANGESAHVAQDALSVASLAGAQKQPLLLTQKGQLPQVVADYIASIKAKVTNSYIIGGTGVVSADIEKQLPGTVARNWGQDAYDTNLAVLKNFMTFNYTRVFVANGETMVDALAGASLAAKNSSPVVLVNGSVKTATTDFLKGKVNDTVVVTALGGETVVPENLRTVVAKPGELNVTSVAGITDAVYDGKDDQVLEVAVGGVTKTVAELKSAGYTVYFQATKDVFIGENYESDNGILLTDLSDILNDGFNYVVSISKGSTVVATSASKHVKVKSADEGSAAIYTASIYLAESEGTISDSPVEITSGILTMDDEAYISVKGTKSNDEYGPITEEVKYSSTDPSIVYVDSANTLQDDDVVYAKVVTGGQEGEATITVTSSGGSKKAIKLTVKDETRKPSASKTEIDKSVAVPIKISKGATQDFLVKVKDQYGEPMKDYELTLKNAISGADEIASAQTLSYVSSKPTGTDDSEGNTDSSGRVVVRVTGGEDTGSGTITIKDKNSNTLGTVAVSNSEAAGYASKYMLNTVPYKTKALNCYSTTGGYVTYLSVDSYDKSGYKIKPEDDTEELTVKVDGTKIKSDQEDTQNSYVIVTYDSAARIIKVVGKKVKSGDIDISVYAGSSSMKLASASITVEDKRVKVTGATFESDIPIISSTSGIKLNRVLKKSGVKTDSDNPVSFKLSDDERAVNIISVNGKILGNLKLSVVDGDITPSFNDDSGDIKIAVEGENESGIIKLTVNKLSGRTSAADATPTNETSVTSVNITCKDLV